MTRIEHIKEASQALDCELVGGCGELNPLGCLREGGFVELSNYNYIEVRLAHELADSALETLLMCKVADGRPTQRHPVIFDASK